MIDTDMKRHEVAEKQFKSNLKKITHSIEGNYSKFRSGLIKEGMRI